VVIHRPGQVVALDTMPLPVLVCETVFTEPVEAHLSLVAELAGYEVAGLPFFPVETVTTGPSIRFSELGHYRS
jgi:hypothetical protein